MFVYFEGLDMRAEEDGRNIFNPAATVHLNLILKRKRAPLYPLSFLPRWQRGGGGAEKSKQRNMTLFFFPLFSFLCLGFTRVE